VQFAGLVSPGLYQINIVVPQVADGDATLQVTVGSTSCVHLDSELAPKCKLPTWLVCQASKWPAAAR
jgi:hypothetical protein